VFGPPFSRPLTANWPRGMITLIVPTRNRCHTLAIVVGSFYRLRLVDEIIFVIDAATDRSSEFLSELSAAQVDKKTVILENRCRLGTAASRMRGISKAENDFILFCDDDLFLQPGYDEVCLRKLQQTGAAAVSGRHLFRLAGEAPDQAIARFGNGLRRQPPFRRHLCHFAAEAYYEGDISLPLTNACILTTKALLLQYKFDSFYKAGNGYREESDFQMNLYVNGHEIIATNDTHAVHLHRSEVRGGGNRVNRLSQIFWATYYTNYFYSKYWNRYAKRMEISYSRYEALLLFAFWISYVILLRPFRHVLRRRGARSCRLHPRRWLRGGAFFVNAYRSSGRE
jgi:glycosyltransferase involved in cell wall biosynthesis